MLSADAPPTERKNNVTTSEVRPDMHSLTLQVKSLVGSTPQSLHLEQMVK